MGVWFPGEEGGGVGEKRRGGLVERGRRVGEGREKWGEGRGLGREWWRAEGKDVKHRVPSLFHIVEETRKIPDTL